MRSEHAQVAGRPVESYPGVLGAVLWDALGGMLACTGNAVAATNLLLNPGFELGSLTGWTPVAATAGVTTSAFDGTYAAQMTRKTGASYGLRTTGFPVSSTASGHAYSTTVDVRTPGITRTLCQRIRE